MFAEHRLGWVHPDNVETVIRHECSHSAWSASDIGDPSIGLSLDQVNEAHEQRPVNRVLCRRVDLRAHELDIRLCRHVEDVPGGRHMVFARHVLRLRDRLPP